MAADDRLAFFRANMYGHWMPQLYMTFRERLTEVSDGVTMASALTATVKGVAGCLGHVLTALWPTPELRRQVLHGVFSMAQLDIAAIMKPLHPDPSAPGRPWQESMHECRLLARLHVNLSALARLINSDRQLLLSFASLSLLLFSLAFGSSFASIDSSFLPAFVRSRLRKKENLGIANLFQKRSQYNPELSNKKKMKQKKNYPTPKKVP